MEPEFWRQFLRHISVALLLLVAWPAAGQLTVDQRTSDFRQLVALYARNYAPYQWKRDVIGFDLLNVQLWLDKVARSQSDLDFYDICVQYVASLQDSHDEFILPSDFVATLDIGIDVYDGKVLIDSIDRSRLPLIDFPFTIGDELISVDGNPVADLIQKYLPYAADASGNPRSRRRLAASTITNRRQALFPRAHEIQDSATIVVRSQLGSSASYSVPWRKAGTPITGEGPARLVQQTRGARNLARRRPTAQVISKGREDGENPWGAWVGPRPERETEAVPEYLKPLAEIQNTNAISGELGLSAFGSFTPVFNPPTSFKLRLGSSPLDAFISGTFPAGNSTIGFIRIATMDPASQTPALSQFASEIAFFQQNTDGLVIDVMRNGGGSLCYNEKLESYLIPSTYPASTVEIRASLSLIQAFSQALTTAKLTGADQSVIDLYSSYLQRLQAALAQSTDNASGLPVCGSATSLSGATDADGNSLAYTKPIVVLTDELSLSAAEAFAMVLQDSGRATIIGMRTDGGGGSPAVFSATAYSEGTARVTRTLLLRSQMVQTPGFPASQYLENTGVYPDIVADYMTVDNLTGKGAPFVKTFSDAIAQMTGK
jgi:hypothetical protein